MKISVLIPAFNAATTIGETLQSILAQQDSDFEIVIADGGSSDDTVAVAQRVGGRHVSVVSEPDAGQLDALYKAVARSRGEILYWLNADDIVMPGAFAVAREKLTDPRVDFVFSDDFAFDSTTRGLYVGATIRGLRRAHHELFYRQLYSETVFFKRYLATRPDRSCFDLRIYTDYYFFLHTLSGARGRWVSKRLGAFRVAAGQMSQKWAARKAQEFDRIRTNYYAARGWNPTEVRLRRILHLPSFIVAQKIWPAVERGWRRLERILTGDRRRRHQTDTFFDGWLGTRKSVSGGNPQQNPADRHLLETSLYR